MRYRHLEPLFAGLMVGVFGCESISGVDNLNTSGQGGSSALGGSGGSTGEGAGAPVGGSGASTSNGASSADGGAGGSSSSAGGNGGAAGGGELGGSGGGDPTPPGDGVSCATPYTVSLGFGTQTVTGTTVGGGSHTVSGNCNSQNPTAADRIYAVTAQADGFLTAQLKAAQTAFDGLVYVQRSCDDDTTTLACKDAVSVPVSIGETVFVTVDGTSGNSGAYTLSLDLSSGKDCTDPIPLTLSLNSVSTLIGDTSTHTESSQGTCNLKGPDVVYEVTLTDPSLFVGIFTNSFSDATTHYGTQCATTVGELSCGASNFFDNQGAGTYYLWVDAESALASGAYKLLVEASDPQ